MELDSKVIMTLKKHNVRHETYKRLLTNIATSPNVIQPCKQQLSDDEAKLNQLKKLNLMMNIVM